MIANKDTQEKDNRQKLTRILKCSLFLLSHCGVQFCVECDNGCDARHGSGSVLLRVQGDVQEKLRSAKLTLQEQRHCSQRQAVLTWTQILPSKLGFGAASARIIGWCCLPLVSSPLSWMVWKERRMSLVVLWIPFSLCQWTMIIDQLELKWGRHAWMQEQMYL